MSTQNIGFHEDLTKIILHLSSNMHLTSSCFFPNDRDGLKYQTDNIMMKQYKGHNSINMQHCHGYFPYLQSSHPSTTL